MAILRWMYRNLEVHEDALFFIDGTGLSKATEHACKAKSIQFFTT